MSAATITEAATVNKRAFCSQLRGRWPFVFGLFPRWQRWQDFRCWRHTIFYPAVRRSAREWRDVFAWLVRP